MATSRIATMLSREWPTGNTIGGTFPGLSFPHDKSKRGWIKLIQPLSYSFYSMVVVNR